MIRRTTALKLRDDASAGGVAEAERVLHEAPERIPELLNGRLGLNMLNRGSRWEYTWDTIFEESGALDSYVNHPYHTGEIRRFFSLDSPDSIIASYDTLCYNPGWFEVPEPEIEDCYKRSLIIQVCEGTSPERTEMFERRLMEMPRHIPSIRNWAFSRASTESSPTRFTHVWEQEFQDLDGYRAYGAHPFHWGPVDEWFDFERPTHIVVGSMQVYYKTSSTVLGWLASADRAS